LASGVSVEREAVKGGIGCCKTAIHELQSASSSLQRSYQQAGSGGWKDQKYAALGGIVEECCSALTKPISQLEECMNKLDQLLNAIEKYEDTNL
jgi:hypothetical protein